MLIYNPNTELVLSLIQEHCEILNQPYHENYKREMVDSLKANGYVATWNDKAYLAGLATYHPLTGELVATELGLYSKEPGAGKILIKDFEDWARMNNITRVCLTTDLNNDVGKYYKRLGYKPVEITYNKELK